MELLGHKLDVCSPSLEGAQQLSVVAAPFYNLPPPAIQEGSSWSTSLITHRVASVFNFNHSHEHEMVSHCGLWF